MKLLSLLFVLSTAWAAAVPINSNAPALAALDRPAYRDNSTLGLTKRAEPPADPPPLEGPDDAPIRVELLETRIADYNHWCPPVNYDGSDAGQVNPAGNPWTGQMNNPGRRTTLETLQKTPSSGW
ncbi:Uu.00g114680.m01.CDS01 [Anthostomella pinea]|uniref:Uu.00g114680.m01.CDS01 n=1 Tax=Anthostomella pinea TaxID=933095 RepID=A0AAI8VGS2_9PEZI|nr:Uu.00g114680.m01.CDS01 [Anthostomella pinea]